MKVPDDTRFVLGIHPSSRGFGWVLFEGPLAPFDWGTVEIKIGKQKGTLARAEKLIARYRPAVIVLEAFAGCQTHRASRIRRICRALIELADENGIETAVYSRAAIRAAFAASGARTRVEIAHAIASHLEVLRLRLPPPPKPWIGEDPNTTLFSAAACVLTYYATEQA